MGLALLHESNVVTSQVVAADFEAPEPTNKDAKEGYQNSIGRKTKGRVRVPL